MSVHTISVALQRAFSHVPSNFIQKFSAQLAKTGSIAVRGDDRGLENLVTHIRQSQTTWIRLNKHDSHGKILWSYFIPSPTVLAKPTATANQTAAEAGHGMNLMADAAFESGFEKIYHALHQVEKGQRAPELLYTKREAVQAMREHPLFKLGLVEEYSASGGRTGFMPRFDGFHHLSFEQVK
jgi:hypothetical protein